MNGFGRVILAMVLLSGFGFVGAVGEYDYKFNYHSNVSCFNYTGHEFCTENEVLGTELFEYYQSIEGDDKLSFYGSREGSVELQPIYDEFYDELFWIDKMLEEYGWWGSTPLAESEVHRLLMAMRYWSGDNIEYNPVRYGTNWYRTSYILEKRLGKCFDQAIVTMSLARSLGLPVKTMKYIQDGGYYHAEVNWWNGTSWRLIDPVYRGRMVTEMIA
jgi:hypothetical protein